MPLEFAKVVANLVEGVGFGRKLKGGENGLMDLFGGPAAEGRSGMQENFQSAEDAMSWILVPG